MTSIDQISDDPKYTIKAVATQTGIRPVTLRAWERRHAVLTPHRSDNRYRLYSDRDVAILRWLKNRVDNGISISSAVTELRSRADQEMWPEVIPTVPARLTGLPQVNPPQHYAGLLTAALMKHDETSSADLLRQAHSIFDLMTVFAEIIVPVLHEIGDAWYNGRIGITTEHFASAFLHGKLLALLQAYPVKRGAPSIIVGCAPMEQHELGPLMIAVLLRSAGYRVEFLGPDVPVDDLVDYASYERPAMIIMSATSPASALELAGMQQKLRKVRPTPIFAYGGQAFDLNPQLRQKVPGCYLGNSLDKATQEIRNLLHNRTKI